jgi:hypothetical protein
MGVRAIPASAGGGIKSVQRGSAAAAGNVTITAVDISKSFVKIFGTTSSGTVASTSQVDSVGSNAVSGLSGSNISAQHASGGSSIGARTLSGGANNLVAAVAQGFLANSTTLTVSHPCRWEVVEFA